VIKKLMELGEMATLTQTLPDETIQVLAEALGQKAEVVSAAEEEPEEPEDLLAALRRSVEEAKRRRTPTRRNGGDGGGEATKEELLERARRLDVKGRSKMSKEELEKAVRRAS
jgi:hypothetical protein